MNLKQICVAGAREMNRKAVKHEQAGFPATAAVCREFRNINMKHARAAK